MKKSEVYRLAALAVMNSEYNDELKLDIIAELINRESLERVFEEQAAKKALEGKAVQA